MLHRLNKAQPKIWSSPNTLQIGLADNKVELENLSEIQQRIVSSLYSGILKGQESVIDHTVGANLGETKSLLERLAPMLQREAEPKFGPWQDLAFAEIARATLDYNVNGEMVLAERWQRSVHIDQLDKTGLLLAKALLASGVGQILSHDKGSVLKTDLGELGFTTTDFGQSRLSAAKKQLAELAIPLSENRIVDLNRKSDPSQKVSFALVVGHLALNPRTYSRWLARDVPHLAILFELEQAVISPIVLPGKTACLNCYQESKVDEVDAWPVIATQLLDLPRMRDDAAALLTATGLACRSVLRHLDQQAGFKLLDTSDEDSIGYQIDYASGNVTRLVFKKHDLCSCGNF